MTTDNFDYLMAMADAVRGRIEQGQLPRQDENGFYVFSAADLDLGVEQVS